MHPSHLALAKDRQAEWQRDAQGRMSGPGRGSGPVWRLSRGLSRWMGVLLVRLGHRLAGPDPLADRPRPVLLRSPDGR
jgi:hypothetical protein